MAVEKEHTQQVGGLVTGDSFPPCIRDVPWQEICGDDDQISHVYKDDGLHTLIQLFPGQRTVFFQQGTEHQVYAPPEEEKLVIVTIPSQCPTFVVPPNISIQILEPKTPYNIDEDTYHITCQRISQETLPQQIERIMNESQHLFEGQGGNI